MKTTYDKIRWGLLAVIYILFITWGKSNIPIMINILLLLILLVIKFNWCKKHKAQIKKYQWLYILEDICLIATFILLFFTIKKHVYPGFTNVIYSIALVLPMLPVIITTYLNSKIEDENKNTKEKMISKS